MFFGGENYFAIFPSVLQSGLCLFSSCMLKRSSSAFIGSGVNPYFPRARKGEFGLSWKDKYFSPLMPVLGICASLA